MFKLGTLKLPHGKHTVDARAVRIPIPASVVLPMVQSVGAPSTPIVKVGEKVCVGTKVAEANGAIGASIHSPVSGTVKKIGDFLLSNGKNCQAITIESDGEMTVDPGITSPSVSNFGELCQALRASGLIGLGGSGYPVANKLEEAASKSVDTIIINGVECEPYISVDSRTMTEGADYVARGIEIVDKYLGAQQIIIAVNKKNAGAVNKMKEFFAGNTKVRIAELPATYPQGEEKTLIRNLTGKTVKDGQTPCDTGCVVLNVTSVAYIAFYLETGVPYIWKTLTVVGSAVTEPKNVTVPVGTSIKDVLAFMNVENANKVIYGGPMTGVAAYSVEDPIFKNTSAIIALNEKDSKPKKQYPCIHCGKCIEACPMKLDPTAFVKAMKVEDKEERAAMLVNASVLSCVDCGCCSYVCPSHRPLAENNKLAKKDLLATRETKEI